MQIVIVLIVLLMIIACSKDEPQERENNAEEIMMTDDEKFSEDKVVAIINGTEINGNTYNQMYLQIKKLTSNSSMNEQVDSEELKSLTIESIIEQKLLIQLAGEKGISISDEQVAEKLEEMKKVNTVGFERMRERFNDADEAIERQLKYELSRREYIKQHVQVDVTDEEVETTYNELKEQIEGIKGLDSIKDELKETIEIQKVDQELNGIITKFKGDSEIEINI